MSRVTRVVTDERASHYWDGHGALLEPYADMFSLTGPCAGIFMLYDREARWDGEGPPEPDYWEDAHARQLGRPGLQFDARRFAEKARALLAGDATP